jgi:hypothetical protein
MPSGSDSSLEPRECMPLVARAFAPVINSQTHTPFHGRALYLPLESSKSSVADFRHLPHSNIISLGPRLHTHLTKLNESLQMSSIDTLLKLSTELSQLGSDLTEMGGKLAIAAATLQQEAANIAEEMSRQWGVDVSVNVGVRLGRGGTGSEVVVTK